jgi:endonuclease-3
MKTIKSGESLIKRTRVIVSLLKKEYPEPMIALGYSNPLELLIAVILSAQCTDVRVNIVTRELFKKYRSAEDYARVVPAELEKDIRSTGFYRMKAKNIIACCKRLVEKHSGKVPSTLNELIQLGGVGRKTANVVLGGAFGIIEGIVVDTHVLRLSARLELSSEISSEKVEMDLMKLLPKSDWFFFANAMILHGRRICAARKPLCVECTLKGQCPYAFISRVQMKGKR